MVLKNNTKIKTSNLHNYLPYAFHYNNQSILTKNGELIFVLKLENRFDDEFKKIIIQNFCKQSFAPYSIWLTTIHEEIKENNKKESNNDLNLKLNKIFSSLPSKTKEFSQEIFISFVFNDDANISDFKFNLASLIKFNQKNYIKRLSSLYMKSMSVISNFIYNLKRYNPRILGIFEENESFYCEILSFFSRINFLPENHKKIKLDSKDLSYYLNQINNFEYKILNQNTIKIQNLKNEKYISVFSCKSNENHEFNLKVTNELLDNDFDFISTEILIKTQKKEILSKSDKSYFEYYKKIDGQIENFDLIENNDLVKKFLNYSSELKNKIANQNFSLNDFVLKKNIISIKANSLEDLNFFSKTLFNKISYKGQRISRENIFLDQVFWCQMPGNFNFFDKIYLTPKENCFFLNDFRSNQNQWIKDFIFKNKTSNVINKINFGEKKIFFSFDDDQKKNLLFFLLHASKNSNFSMNYINYQDDLYDFFKDELKITEKNKASEVSTNFEVDFIVEQSETERKKQIKEIFEIIFSFLKILWFANFDILKGKIYVSESLQNQENLENIKNLAKKITLEINKNLKSMNFKKILKTFSYFKLLPNFPDIEKALESLNQSQTLGSINFYIKNNKNNIDQKIILIFTLIKIIEKFLQAYNSLSSNLSIIFFIEINELIEFENLEIMINEISFILKKQNIFLFFNFDKQNIKQILKIYNKVSAHLSLFAFDLCAKDIIQIVNPNFSADINFFKNLLIIINDLKFFLNDFPTKQIDNLILEESL